MSKINAVRLINLNYNNNAIKISDEIFHLNGDSTLISLRNGGGKSVLVQMIMAPFVHKRYRDAKDRPFESYFTGNKPTFILVEWVLDQGAGYVLTGMMIRKSQHISGEEMGQPEELEIVNLINEYKEPCVNDIYHFPVVEKSKKEISLKNFSVCCQMFESWKRDKSMSFSYYDMNNMAHSRQYFEKLKEYQINYKEWETIIKKVNLKESGLSELFADCKDEKGLVEKWFLDAVESKLNKDKNRMKEFQNIIEKYITQYKDNRSKIKRRDTIRHFQEEGEKISKEAISYHNALKQIAFHENRIAGLREELECLQRKEVASREDVLKELEEIHKKHDYLIYKKLSGEYYELEKQERFHSSNRDMIEIERESLEKECAKIKNNLYLLECAKQQGKVDEERHAFLEASERLEVSKKKEEQLEPERQNLGATLKRLYWEQLEVFKELQEQNTKEREKIQDSLTTQTGHLEEFQNQTVEYASKIAVQNTKINAFSQKEIYFNKRYKENLARNILGEYEPGALQICQQVYEKTLDELTKTRISCRQKLESQAEEKKCLERSLEDLRQALVENRQQYQELSRICEEFKNELSERRKILRYLDLDESQSFETKTILAVSDRKLKELQQIKRKLEQEEEQQQREYERLTQGKVLELPKEFEAMLKELGIRYIYGMDWLRKNGQDSSKNKGLVRCHPFLPYSLILSSKELKTLTDHMERANKQEVYTSFPVPMILREELKDDDAKEERHILELERIRFYVYFNRNLLDEKALKKMTIEKEALLTKLRGSIAQRQEEYQEYFEKQERIRNQKLTKEAFQENQDELERNMCQEKELKEQIDNATEQIKDLEEQIEKGRSQIQNLENESRTQRQRLEDFKEFSTEYDLYLEERSELERCEKKAVSLKEQKKLCKEQIERLELHLKTLENDAMDLRDKVHSCQEKHILYEGFTGSNYQEGELSQLEARYWALTEGVSQKQKELEERVLECRKRYQNALEELHWLRNKYNLGDKTWTEILYSREEEEHQEAILRDRTKKKAKKDSEWNEEDKKTSLLHQELEQKKKKMMEECGKKEPISKNDMVLEDIEAQLNELSWQEKEKKNQEEFHSRKISSYENNLTSLAEYNDIELKEAFSWEKDFSQMNRKQLDDFKGETVREYRLSKNASRECYTRLVQQINNTLRMGLFQEDFYKKPLEYMLELSEDASQVLAQLNTTVQSYQNLIEKLDVDISIVEKEKEKIAELLEDYLKEIHENMGKIDQNSTITVRDRSIKMLKIILPTWEENMSLYRLRISDFLDELTKKGIERFERNENAQEYFGFQLTTKNLYDTVIGIGNLQIHLFKIEEQREYAITWADVAKNSGGEGFLSAFVILSSLLYYMRRDDSDFFADRNEGKVLIMDNPFAQTNAVHLLKPLMDMAKKTNTQLICLSGLGGESIYNRFDNIYVLNLISASLRNSVQYLKSEHIKGTQADTLIASRVQVTEQTELMF